MQAQSTRPVRTFTIGFSDDLLNEAPYARQVADILGTDHTEHLFSADDALRIVPQLPIFMTNRLATPRSFQPIWLSALTRHTCARGAVG